MGCGASCSTPDHVVCWYTGDSPESLRWQSEETGFGIGRNRSFIDCFQKKVYTNRKGNENGELAGHLLVFNHLGQNPNYAYLSHSPHFVVGPETKIFAKAFLGCPLGRMPIGENVLTRQESKIQPKTKHGPVLLALCPRIISIFVDVDGQPAKYEAFDTSALTDLGKYCKDMETKPAISQTGIKGAFFSYVVSRDQDEFFFLHFPILTKHSDCSSVDTGTYGSEIVRNFIKLFSSLSPGQHKIEIRVVCYHDHCDFSYFPLNKNINARGIWYSKLVNSRLRDPHPRPQKLVSMAYPIAEGSFTVELPQSFNKLTKTLLDRRAPRERYKEADHDVVRKDARVCSSHLYIFLIK